MDFQVAEKKSLDCESLVANNTNIWLFNGVLVNMTNQILTENKTIVTQRTQVWPLTCVAAHMLVKLWLVFEELMADPALNCSLILTEYHMMAKS